MLHEDVTPARWIGILLISAGVGFVAGGPALTEVVQHDPPPQRGDECIVETVGPVVES